MKKLLLLCIFLIMGVTINAQTWFIDTTAAGIEVRKFVSTKSSADKAPFPVQIVSGSSGSGGDASAANQLTQITRLDSILARMARQLLLNEEMTTSQIALYDLQKFDSVKVATSWCDTLYLAGTFTYWARGCIETYDDTLQVSKSSSFTNSRIVLPNSSITYDQIDVTTGNFVRLFLKPYGTAGTVYYQCYFTGR